MLEENKLCDEENQETIKKLHEKIDSFKDMIPKKFIRQFRETALMQLNDFQSIQTRTDYAKSLQRVRNTDNETSYYAAFQPSEKLLADGCLSCLLRRKTGSDH